MQIFITCQGGLEELLQKELQELGIPDTRTGHRGVFAPIDMKHVYTINYCSRLATRVLLPLHNFRCRDREDLYQEAFSIPWEKFIRENQTIAIDANVDVEHAAIKNSHFAALVVKDAICDRLREKQGSRPSVNLESPDIQLNLFVHRNQGLISFDTSGAPLFKRGWRQDTGEAPLQESLASAILLKAGYGPEDVLCDPLCGSGTILIEAAMMATHTPAGFFRKSWGFMLHPSFNPAEWQEIKNAADQKITSLPPGIITGADHDFEVLAKCRLNLKAAGFAFDVKDTDIRPYIPQNPTLILTNPPYGKRIPASNTLFPTLLTWLQKRKVPRAYFLAPADQTFPLTKKTLTFFHGGIKISLFHFIA